MSTKHSPRGAGSWGGFGRPGFYIRAFVLRALPTIHREILNSLHLSTSHLLPCLDLRSQRSKFGEDNETGNQWAEYLKGESVREKTLEICKGVPLSIWLITYMHA